MHAPVTPPGGRDDRRGAALAARRARLAGACVAGLVALGWWVARIWGIS